MKYLLPALAVIGGVAAQNDNCNGPSTTIANSGDAGGLASCTTYKGDVTIATQAAQSIALDGVKEITGDLVAKDATNLTGLSGSSLQTIGGKFNLNGLTILSNLNFPELSTVQTIQWVALPALQELSFTTAVTMAENVLITNTQLNSLNGINLQEVGIFDINNNPYLKEISVQLGNVSQYLSLEANNKGLVAKFPNLEWANNMTVRNVSEMMIPSLASVNGSFGLYDNFFESLAGPNLTSVGGSLAFDSNGDLKNISLPMLTKVGGAYQISNNTDLGSIDGFKKLQTVAGAVDFTGAFKNISLPALQDVRGNFDVKSSAVLDCSSFTNLKSNGVVKGKYQCKGKVDKPNSSSSNGASSTGSSSSSTSSSAAGSLRFNAGAVAGLLPVVGGAFALAF